MATFANLNKNQQMDYTKFLLDHYLLQRKVISDYQHTEDPNQQAALQGELDGLQTVDLSVDAWLGG